MAVTVTKASKDSLRRLPTTARPLIQPEDIEVPGGYKIEPVLAGLSFPCGMGFADDGSLFILEGGSTWPTRPYMPARILRLDTATGKVEEVAVEVLGGPRGVVYRDGAINVTVKGGYHAHVDRFDLKTRKRTLIVDGIPSGGWHEPSDPVFGPDGLLYFGNGSVSQNGVCLPQGFTVDLPGTPPPATCPARMSPSPATTSGAAIRPRPFPSSPRPAPCICPHPSYLSRGGEGPARCRWQEKEGP